MLEIVLVRSSHLLYDRPGRVDFDDAQTPELTARAGGSR